MCENKVGAIVIKSIALLVVLGTAARAQDATTPYPKMAPIDQYLMADQGAEMDGTNHAIISTDAQGRLRTINATDPQVGSRKRSGAGMVCLV